MSLPYATSEDGPYTTLADAPHNQDRSNRMGLLMADTTLIDERLAEALRELDRLSGSVDALDVGSNPSENEIDDRPARPAPSANLLTWPRHLIGIR